MNAQTFLAGGALVIMGAICAALIFHAVPQDNQQLVTFALGAISGALTVGGTNKALEKPAPPPIQENTVNVASNP